MKRDWLIVLMLFITLLVHSQSTGGEVSRKPKVNKNTIRNGGSIVRNNAVSSRIWINRTFDGIVLGKSTKQNVINYLKKKNIKYEYKIVSGRPSINCFIET